MSSTVAVELSLDAALVLDAFFARFAHSGAFRLRSNAEFLAFQQVAAQLERGLSEPFEPAYARLVQAPAERLSRGYEGLAPGVEPMAKPP